MLIFFRLGALVFFAEEGFVDSWTDFVSGLVSLSFPGLDFFFDGFDTGLSPKASGLSSSFLEDFFPPFFFELARASAPFSES